MRLQAWMQVNSRLFDAHNFVSRDDTLYDDREKLSNPETHVRWRDGHLEPFVFERHRDDLTSYGVTELLDLEMVGDVEPIEPLIDTRGNLFRATVDHLR